MMDVVEFRPQYQASWKEFLQRSNNGTLFQDLDFLAYHPPGRFDTRHLLFLRDGEIVALLPAAVVTESDGRKFLKSPYGASVGGFVLPVGQSAETVCKLVERLKQHASDMGLQGIEMRLAPSVFMIEPHDHLGFALLAGGFRLVCRWLCQMLVLPQKPESVLNACSSRMATYYRAGLAKGFQAREVSIDRLDDFHRLLLLTMAKHGATSTHTREEIEDLFRRVPGRLRLFLCEKDDVVLAGILLFVLNEAVAYTFYIVQDDAHRRLHGLTVLMLHIARQATLDGFRILDFGPGTMNDMTMNHGVNSFKERLGARGFCRDTWRWERG